MFKYGNFTMQSNIKDVGLNAELLIYGEIADDDFWGDTATPNLVNEEINKIGDTSQLDIRINSYGGSVFAGVAIASMIDRKKKNKNGSRCKITTYVDGIAASMGSVIAMVGDEVVMPENAMMMVHKPSNMIWGNADDMRKQADILDTIEDNLINFYMRHFNGTKDEIQGLLQNETWLNGKECLEKGLCTQVEEVVQIAANANEYIINGVKFDKKIRNISNACIENKVNVKGGENEMYISEEIQNKVKDFIANGKSCILNPLENGQFEAVEKSVETVEKSFIENSMVTEIIASGVNAQDVVDGYKAFIEESKNKERIKAEQDILKAKAENYDKMYGTAIENALLIGQGAMAAKNAKTESKNEFDVERYRKILSSFTIEEVNAQADDWALEKAALLNAGTRVSAENQGTVSKKEINTNDFKI